MDEIANGGAVAVFDLDGTITRGDTFLAFLIHLARRRPRRLLHAVGLPLAAVRFRLGRLSNHELKSIFLTAIVGVLDRAQMDGLVSGFLPGYMRRAIRPAALARIEWHRARGHGLILASASLDLYAVPLGARLGFDRTLCTRTAWRGGILTGALDGPNLLGLAKLAAVRDAIEGAGARPEVFAYSDHHGDLPLLRFADRAVAVCPNRGLRSAARTDGLTVENW